MTTRVVHRPARIVQPLTEEEPLVMSPPPVLPEGKAVGGMMTMLPLAGSAAAMSMMMFMRGSGFAIFGAVIMVASLVAAALFYVTQRGQATRKHNGSGTWTIWKSCASSCATRNGSSRSARLRRTHLPATF